MAKSRAHLRALRPSFLARGKLQGRREEAARAEGVGIGIVWLLPVNEIGSIVPANGGEASDAPYGNPYAVKSYETVNAEYGSDGTSASAAADLKDLVRAAHGLGMHVILDWVPNHTAWDNPLIVQHPDWYARANGVVKAVDGFPWIAQLDWSSSSLRDYMTGVMTSPGLRAGTDRPLRLFRAT